MGFEASGRLYNLMRLHLGDAEVLALRSHLYDDDADYPSSSDLSVVASTFVSEMVELNKKFHDFVVVFEGLPYAGKASEGLSRTQAAKDMLKEGKPCAAVKIPDCLVRNILLALEDAGVRWLCPPAEADSQLAYLQVWWDMDKCCL